VAVYKQLDEDGQVDFKGKSKVFARTYDFLASILPYTNADWEKLLRECDLLLRGLSRQARHKADQVTPVVKALVVDWLIVP